MKFVKVTALAAAMAASFGAIAELTAMDDESLEDVTGQSGITIEQSLGATDIYYVDGDGVSASELGGQVNGAALLLSLETVTGNSTGISQGGAIQMDIDVVSSTPASGSQNALRISQSLTADSYLHVSGLSISSTGSSATSGNTAFAAALGATASSSIGDIYIDLGDTTMYVYGH